MTYSMFGFLGYLTMLFQGQTL